MFSFRDQDNMPSSNYLVIQTPGDPITHGPSTGGGNIGSSTAATSQLNSPSSGSQPPPFGPSGGQSANQGHLSGGKGSAVVSESKSIYILNCRMHYNVVHTWCFITRLFFEIKCLIVIFQLQWCKISIFKVC